MTRALEWDGSALVALDQTALPGRVDLVRLTTVDQVVGLIREVEDV